MLKEAEAERRLTMEGEFPASAFGGLGSGFTAWDSQVVQAVAVAQVAVVAVIAVL